MALSSLADCIVLGVCLGILVLKVVCGVAFDRGYQSAKRAYYIDVERLESRRVDREAGKFSAGFTAGRRSALVEVKEMVVEMVGQLEGKVGDEDYLAQ